MTYLIKRGLYRTPDNSFLTVLAKPHKKSPYVVLRNIVTGDTFNCSRWKYLNKLQYLGAKVKCATPDRSKVVFL